MCLECEEDYWHCVVSDTINCERCVKQIIHLFFRQPTEKEKLYGHFQQDSAASCTADYSM
jgi:hypothetical protein